MYTEARQPEQHICHRGTRPSTADDPVPVLEAYGPHIHFIDADPASHLNVVLAADHVERVIDCENVGTALKGRVAAIPQRPVGGNAGGGHPATATRAGRVRYRAAIQIGAGNPEYIRLASAASLGGDVVENPVIAEAKLIHACGGKNVCFPDRNVTRMVYNSLIAAEGSSLGMRSGGASRVVGAGLVITEASEHRIHAGKVVVQPDVELRLVQRAHGFAQEVVSVHIVAWGRQRIEINHCLPNGINNALT